MSSHIANWLSAPILVGVWHLHLQCTCCVDMSIQQHHHGSSTAKLEQFLARVWPIDLMLLQVFIESSMPIIDYYNKQGKVRQVDADREPSTVFSEVRKLFEQGFD